MNRSALFPQGSAIIVLISLTLIAQILSLLLDPQGLRALGHLPTLLHALQPPSPLKQLALLLSLLLMGIVLMMSLRSICQPTPHYWRWLLPLYSTVLALQIPLQPYPQLPLLLLLAAIPIFSPPLPQLLLCLILPMGITLLLQPQYWPLLFLGLFLSLLLWRQGRLWQRAHLLAYRQQQRLQRQLARRSSQDPLTGLANGRHFAQRLLQQVSESKRSKSPLSLCLLDVDYFTAYNQYYGSAQGDHCLCTLAVRLSQCSQRQSDLVARLSGDTFALLLPATDRKGAEKLLQRFHEQLAQKPIAHAGSPIHSDVTLTTAIEQWQLGNDHQLFFNRAKHTLQQAKLAEMPLDYAP